MCAPLPALLPPGLVPEELLTQLISKRVDYYFARICQHTDLMMVSQHHGRMSA